MFPFSHPQIYLQNEHIQAPREHHKANVKGHSPPLFDLKAVSIVYDGGDTDVKVRHLPVQKVEDLCTGPAVELGFYSLRVCVRGELLAGVLGDQKQCVVFRVRDLELVGAD